MTGGVLPTSWRRPPAPVQPVGHSQTMPRPSLPLSTAPRHHSPQDRHLQRGDSMHQLHSFALNLGHRRPGACFQPSPTPRKPSESRPPQPSQPAAAGCGSGAGPDGCRASGPRADRHRPPGEGFMQQAVGWRSCGAAAASVALAPQRPADGTRRMGVAQAKGGAIENGLLHQPRPVARQPDPWRGRWSGQIRGPAMHSSSG